MDNLPPVAVALGFAVLTRAIFQTSLYMDGTVLCCTFILVKHVLASRKSLALAPGPTRWPLLGNALQIPQVHPWLTYSKWADIYGDIIHLDVLGQPIVVLNSADIARDLLDKRSSIYSDRPRLVMAGDLVGYSEGFVLQPYGENWRRQRKLVGQDFNQATVPRYYRLQETEARKLVKSILDDPSSLVPQIKMRIAEIIMEANYGYTVKSEDDPYITVPLTAMENFSKASAPGAWVVDFIPQLQHLPTWVPGTGFLRTAQEWHQIVLDATWKPYLWCKKNLPMGVARTPSLCATSLTQVDGEISKEDEYTLVWAASAVLGGGLDTNMSTILTFFLAMLRYPDVQVKAQAEIDSVIGPNRLPSIADRMSLPFIRSLITEVFRWNPALPLGLPHSLSSADVYNGVHLPKGALVMPNVWHMLHDPKTYVDPLEFRPERYQNSDAQMQKGTIFAVIATVLATCQIVPVVDERGRAIIPEVVYTSGTIVFPQAFKCNVKSRSAQAQATLAQW